MTDDPGRVGKLTTLGQIEALSNPLRTRILRHAAKPVTVAELAERFDLPKTRLYYHVNVLAEAGLLVQVDERKSGARIERIFLRTASDLQLTPGLAESIDDRRKAAEMATAIIIEPARGEIEDSLEIVLRGGRPTGSLGRTVARLSAADVDRFTGRIEELTAEIRDAGQSTEETARTLALTVAFVPTE